MSVSMIMGGIGAAVGGYFGGAFGAQIGYMAGTMVGNMIDPPKGTTTEGARLGDLSTTTAGYGIYYGIVYGYIKRGSNLFWASPKKEHKHKQSSGGGKGTSPTNSVITYTYSQSLAYQLNDGPISALLSIYNESYEKVYSSDTNSSVGSKVQSSEFSGYFTVYYGTEDQLPDPEMEFYEGVGNVPAYRGMAYVVFKDLDQGSNGIVPQFTFEVAGIGAAIEGDTFTITEQISNTHGYVTDRIENGEAYRNNFFVNPRQIEHNGVWFKNSLVISAISDFKASLTPSLIFTDDIRQYTNPALDDHSFKFNFKDGYIYSVEDYLPQFQVENALTAPAIRLSASYETNLQKEGERIYMPVGSLLERYWLYINTKNIKNPISRSDAVSNAEPVFILGQVLGGSMSDTTYFVGLDEYLPEVAEGKYFKGAVVDNDGIYGYLFYGDADYETISDVYYSKFLRVDNKITITESGKFEDQLISVGTSSSRIFWYNNGDPVWANTDNNVIYLSNTENNTKVYKFENLKLVYKYELTDGNLLYQKRDAIISAYKGILYEINGYQSGMYSTSRTIEKQFVKLSDIMKDIYKRAGVPEANYNVEDLEGINVRGYFVNSKKSARAVIEELQQVFFFDTFKSQGVLKSVRRGKDIVAVITPDDFIINNDSSGDPLEEFDFTFLQEASLPQQVSVSYADYDQDYRPNIQYARRLSTFSTESVDITIPLLLTSDEAVEIAHKFLYTAWTEREQVSFTVSIDFMHLEPTDVIQVSDIRNNVYVLRITEVADNGSGQIKITAVQDERVALQQSIKGASSDDMQTNINARYFEDTDPLPMNLPLLTNSQPDSNNWYLGVSRDGDGKWQCARVYTSKDNQTYSSTNEMIFERSDALVYGYGLSTLQDSDCYALDTSSYIDVRLESKDLELDSFDLDYIYRNKVNYALIGNEVIQFANADLIEEDVYRLSCLIRGVGGTEEYAKNHKSGEKFILLEMTKISNIVEDLSSLNTTTWLYAQSLGKSPSGFNYNFVNNGLTIKPLSPYAFKIKNDNNFNLHWYRRARKDAGWIDNIDVPLDENSEIYSVVVYSDDTYTNVIREETVNNTTEYEYTSEKQILDFGSVQDDVFIEIFQVSSRFGKGWGGKAA